MEIAKNNKALESIAQKTTEDEENEYHERCQAITNYESAIRGAMLNGKIVLGDLYGWYKAQNPNMHRFCNDKQVDLPALTYSLQRHPEAITRVEGLYLLAKTSNSDRDVRRVNCMCRNRAMFDLGKELEIVVREKEADSFDIVSCAIMYGIEAEKIKGKLASEKKLLTDVKSFDSRSDDEKRQILARLANTLGVEFDDLKRYNSSLNNRLLPLLKNITKHKPGEMIIKFDPEFIKSNYPRNARAWRVDIEKDLGEYTGRPVVIISSDTHSVVNCLTGFAEENQQLINDLAAKNGRLANLPKGDRGLLYYSLQQLCRTAEGKELLKAKIEHEQSLGIKFIRDRHDTGIDVQIIDIRKLLEKNSYHIDPRVKVNREKAKEHGLVIINMDYSFGKQGRHSMQELCNTFGSQIEGIALIGKAGIICEEGKKFDIMLPTHVQKQIKGGIYFFPNGNCLAPGDFKEAFNGGIHADGPMITVPGTVMQNEEVYRHYMKEPINVIGTEMEAAHYLDSIVKAHAYKILRKDLNMYVGYWASDNPLNPHESLAESHMDYGYVPLYALTSVTLNKILNRK